MIITYSYQNIIITYISNYHLLSNSFQTIIITSLLSEARSHINILNYTSLRNTSDNPPR